MHTKIFPAKNESTPSQETNYSRSSQEQTAENNSTRNEESLLSGHAVYFVVKEEPQVSEESTEFPENNSLNKREFSTELLTSVKEEDASGDSLRNHSVYGDGVEMSVENTIIRKEKRCNMLQIERAKPCSIKQKLNIKENCTDKCAANEGKFSNKMSVAKRKELICEINLWNDGLNAAEDDEEDWEETNYAYYEPQIDISEMDSIYTVNLKGQKQVGEMQNGIKPVGKELKSKIDTVRDVLENKEPVNTCGDLGKFPIRSENEAIYSYKRLEEETTRENGKRYVCHICQKGFDYESSMKRHLVVHTDAKPFSCKECHKQFSRIGNLKQHMTVHTGLKLFSCKLCQKSFSQVGHLQQHMTIHTGVKPYKCDECHKQFNLKCSLKNHMTVHTGLKPYKCEQCHKKFSRKSHLDIHMHTHTGARPYRCNECHKHFSHKSTLTSHMNVHTGVKPYACNECNKQFSQSISLKRHMVTHENTKPYSCKDCRKEFSLKSSLNRHISNHSNSRQHSCKECQKQFSQKSSLDRHLITHTDERPYSYKQCNKNSAEALV